MLRHVAWALLPLLSIGCADVIGDDTSDHESEPLGTVSSELTATSPVSSAVSASCSTTSVKGLSLQLVEEIQCLSPGSLKSIENVSGLSLGAAVFPYLQTPAADALVAAQKERGVTLTINSGLRALPQQFLLYRWYQTGRCGISLAAKPGTSNHESGIALDVSDSSGWRSSLTGEDFRWLGSSDPVHYDFKGPGTVAMKGLSVLAFQRLWNRNNPNDKIAEDGEYGPATEERLGKSPVGGFAKGANCSAPPPAAASIPAADPAEEPATVPDAPEPDPIGAVPTSTDEETPNARRREAPSIDDGATPAASQGCAVAHVPATQVTWGAPLALGLVGAGLVLRRRRRA